MKIRIFVLLLASLVISCEPENTAPLAVFSCNPPEGNVKTLFDLDARASIDPDGLKSLLEFRWDYNGDGVWDTPFGPYRISSCSFPVPGNYEIRLEVKDTYEASTLSTFLIRVDSLHHITDPRDGQVYPVIKLGSCWWMGRNLNIGKSIETSKVPQNDGQIEKYVYPAEDQDSLNGGLYTWPEMMGYEFIAGAQGICPPGWRLPTDDDWRNMLSVFRWTAPREILAYQITGEKFVVDQKVTHDSYKTEGAIWRLLRETGNTGFDAIMLGYRDPDGVFSDRDYHFQGRTASFWTSTEFAGNAIRVRLYQTENHEGDIFRFADNRNYAFSVRCIKETL